MNIQQKRYLTKRAEEIEFIKKKEVSDKYSKDSLPETINVKIINSNLLSGKIKRYLSDPKNYNLSYSGLRTSQIDLFSLPDCIDIQNIEEQFKQRRNRLEKRRDTMNSILDQITRDFAQVKDEIMLGDDKRAMEILQELTNKDYTQEIK